MATKDKGFIYKITSPSGRVYIGQTTNLKKRVATYKSTNAKGQTKLNRSILKYGWDAHRFEVIDECSIILPTILNMLELYWIKEYDCVDNGLNCMSGGSFGRHSDESKKKMSESAKKRVSPKRLPLTQEQKDKISAGRTGKNVGSIPWNKNLKSNTPGKISKQTIIHK